MKTWQHILLGILLGAALTAGIFLIAGSPQEEPIKLVAAEEFKITVYLTGNVKKPGLYELPPGSRVNDLLQFSGDLEEQPDIRINLARILSDGEEVFIPFENSVSTTITTPEIRIPLNTATLSELDTLPGIGETRAQAIIDYRQQHGNFTSLNELNLVQGLSDELIETIKPYLIIE